MFPSPEAALEAGRGYLANAKDALAQQVIHEERLYVWQNQVSALDEFLADTEELESNGDLPKVRDEARFAKNELERKIAEFYKDEIDDSPDAVVPALLDVAGEIYDEGEKSLKAKVKGVEDLSKWEEPLLAIKSWLADSEPYGSDKTLGAARADMRKLKHELERRIEDVVKAWKASEAQGGGDDDDGDE